MMMKLFVFFFWGGGGGGGEVICKTIESGIIGTIHDQKKKKVFQNKSLLVPISNELKGKMFVRHKDVQRCDVEIELP